jgi:hypothetical protein
LQNLEHVRGQLCGKLEDPVTTWAIIICFPFCILAQIQCFRSGSLRIGCERTFQNSVFSHNFRAADCAPMGESSFPVGCFWIQS